MQRSRRGAGLLVRWCCRGPAIIVVVVVIIIIVVIIIVFVVGSDRHGRQQGQVNVQTRVERDNAGGAARKPAHTGRRQGRGVGARGARPRDGNPRAEAPGARGGHGAAGSSSACARGAARGNLPLVAAALAEARVVRDPRLVGSAVHRGHDAADLACDLVLAQLDVVVVSARGAATRGHGQHVAVAGDDGAGRGATTQTTGKAPQRSRRRGGARGAGGNETKARRRQGRGAGGGAGLTGAVVQVVVGVQGWRWRRSRRRWLRWKSPRRARW